MRFSFPGRHSTGAHHHHPNRHRLEKAEGMADLLTIGLIIALGLAMVIGLVTASGETAWMN
jgi:hypothetical protein